MFGKLKQFARNTWVLKGFVGWRALYRFGKGDLGLVVCDSEESFAGGNILVLAPHPDDEIFGCGGTLRRHILNGASVTVLFLHNGILGNPSGASDPAIVPIRQAESKHALDLLGGAQSEFWDHADGELPISGQEAKKLADVIIRIKPKRIYVPWFGDNHYDHESTWRLLVKALNCVQFAGEIWQYEVWAALVPNRLVPLGAVLDSKVQAMRCFPSQSVSTDYESGILGLNRYRGSMAGLSDPAEAFFAADAEHYLTLARAVHAP